MPRLTPKDSLQKIGAQVSARLRKHGVKLTTGGEPTFVPNEPVGPEWSITAVGPTKLNYAYALANTLIKNSLHEAIPFFSPGKSYPGEVNPRWTIHLLWNLDGSPLTKTKMDTAGRAVAPKVLKENLLKNLGVPDNWIRAIDTADPKRAIWVLPLDHDGKKWKCESWKSTFGKPMELTAAEGPAGLRMPLFRLPAQSSRRALSLESKPDGLHIFLPPLLQGPFLQLLEFLSQNLAEAGIGKFFFEGYIPSDEKNN